MIDDFLYMAYQMGIHANEFYRMTHKEFMAAVKGYKEAERMENIRTARICTVIAEVNRNPKKKSKPWKIEDFMPVDPNKKKKKQTPEDMLNMFKMLTKEKPQKVVK